MTSGATDGYAEKLSTGLTAAWRLALLTAVEFLVAVLFDSGPVWLYLLPILAAKAWIIMDYFMHIRHIKQEEQG